YFFCFFFQAEDGIRDFHVTGVQTCALPIYTQSNPGVAKAMAMKAADENTFALFGPVFSGSVLVSTEIARQAEIPNFVAGEASAKIGRASCRERVEMSEGAGGEL